MTHMTQTIVALTVTAVFALTGAVSADEPVGNNPQESAAAVPVVVQATVTVLEATENRAQFRTGPDAAWQKLTTDSQLGIGSEIRTLPRSTVKLQIGPNNVITLKGVGTLAIGDLSVDNDAKVITALLAKKYGRMNAQVAHIGDFRNDTKVATPGQVMAVKGTNFGHTGFGSFQSTTGNSGSVQVNGQHNVGAGDESNTNNPDPNKNASNKSDVNKNSTPGGDTGGDPNAGIGGGEGTGGVQQNAQGYNSWGQSVSGFEGMIPRDGGQGGGGGPKL